MSNPETTAADYRRVHSELTRYVNEKRWGWVMSLMEEHVGMILSALAIAADRAAVREEHDEMRRRIGANNA